MAACSLDTGLVEIGRPPTARFCTVACAAGCRRFPIRMTPGRRRGYGGGWTGLGRCGYPPQFDMAISGIQSGTGQHFATSVWSGNWRPTRPTGNRSPPNGPRTAGTAGTMAQIADTTVKLVEQFGIDGRNTAQGKSVRPWNRSSRGDWVCVNWMATSAEVSTPLQAFRADGSRSSRSQ